MIFLYRLAESQSLSLFLILLLILSTMSCKTEKEESKDVLALLGITFYTRSCAGQNAFPSNGQIGSLTRLQILPSQTASINTYNNPHQVYPPLASVSSKNILSVFYPGTGSSPCEISAILQQGATRGYHVIGLSYPNNDAVNSLCNQGDAKSDIDCFVKIRKEVVTGSAESTYVDVDVQNSIEGRLLSLLQYLIQTRPKENWDQYISSNQINWPLVYIGGHSQGSGHAAYHGKIRATGRVSIYSGVSDYSLNFETLPPWMSLVQTAPVGSYYGFIHENDSIANFSGNMNQVIDAWNTALGMTGTITNTSVGTPYQNSKRLVTSVCNGMGSASIHSCPMTNGFQNIWNYISFP
jgi:hypothetical protein